MKKALLILCAVMMITGWYSCTKDTAPTASGSAVCDSTKVSYVKDIKPIFAASCAVPGCHDASTRQDGLDYAQYADSKISMQSTGNASLLCRIKGSTCGIMMPEGADPLPDSTIQLITKWQSDGFCN